MAVYSEITLESGVVIAVAIGRARFLALGTILTVYRGRGSTLGVIIAVVIGWVRSVNLGACWFHDHAKVIVHAHNAARVAFLRLARA